MSGATGSRVGRLRIYTEIFIGATACFHLINVLKKPMNYTNLFFGYFSPELLQLMPVKAYRQRVMGLAAGKIPDRMA
jgi:hypothetical protein